jgi:hypothetical protein
VPTHKRHKSSFKHSKTIYVFTSGRVIITLQIHSRKQAFYRGLKWPVQNGPSIPESSRICAILLQDLMKTGVCGCEVEMLLHTLRWVPLQPFFFIAEIPLWSEFTNEKFENEVNFWGFNSQKSRRKVKNRQIFIFGL